MLNKWIIYGSIVAVSVAAGVFIGGGPDAVRNAIGSSDRPPPRLIESSSTTTTSTTEPPATISTVPTSTTSTTMATTSTIDTSTSTTVPTSTTTSTTTTEPQPEPIGREALRVAVVNGSGVQGIAGRIAGDLRVAGYANTATRNSALIETTTIFSAGGYELEAQRLAEDTGLDPSNIAPLDDAPNFGGGQFDLVLVLGTDNQDPGA